MATHCGWFDGFSQNESIESASVSAPDNVQGKSVVRVCSWNVRNYSVSRRWVRGEWRESPKPESEKKLLRSTVKKINPDILILQEMGDAAFLEELRADLRADGVDYPYAAATTRDSPSRLAMLSKLNPEKIFSETSLSFTYRGDRRFSPRGTLGAEFKTCGTSWFVFGVHLKSKQGAKKSDSEFEPFRRSEAAAIGAKIRKVTADSDLIAIVGDFNDEPSESLMVCFGFDKLVRIPFATSESDSFTYFWAKKNKKFVYDYFLASARMASLSSRVSIGALSEASDHRAVFADFDFSAASSN